MLKRKMLDKLIAWKQKAGGREALLIEGARRVGKSTIVEEFGRTQYKSYILIDFTRLPRDVRVVPEFLRTLVFARPRGDDQFADCTFSPSLDMSR